MKLSLLNLKKNRKAKIVEIKCDQVIGNRLISLGVLPGDLVEVVGKSPFGSPLAIKHGDDNFFALRKEQAAQVFVCEVDKGVE